MFRPVSVWALAGDVSLYAVGQAGYHGKTPILNLFDLQLLKHLHPGRQTSSCSKSRRTILSYDETSGPKWWLFYYTILCAQPNTISFINRLILEIAMQTPWQDVSLLPKICCTIIYTGHTYYYTLAAKVPFTRLPTNCLNSAWTCLCVLRPKIDGGAQAGTAAHYSSIPQTTTGVATALAS